MQTLTPARPLLRLQNRAAPMPLGPQEADGADEPSATEVIHSINSTSLLHGAKSVQIAHNGSVYRLQATRLGKLILTK